MKTKMKTGLLIALMMIMGYGHAQVNRERPYESLKGIRGIRVEVRYSAPAESQYGLTSKELQDAVELRLRANNVRILGADEWLREPGRPYLLITVTGTDLGKTGGGASSFFFTFTSDLIQQVRLDRKSAIQVEGATWSKGYAIVVPRDDLRDVTLKISDVAEEFAKALNKANSQ